MHVAKSSINLHIEMATPSLSYACILFLLSLQLVAITCCHRYSCQPCDPIEANDEDRIEFAQNLEFLETEFFCNGALGKGLDAFEPEFAKGGPPPIGARIANLDPLNRRIIEEFCYQEIGHLR